MTSAGTPWGEPRRDALAEKVHAILPCWCDKAYTDRGLVQHDCPRHNFADEVLDLICAQAAAQGHDIEAYRGALGYAVRGDHDGRLTDGTIPNNGLAEAKAALVARLGESLKWDHNTQGPNHVRSSCDVCALLAELTPTPATP